MGGPTRVDRSGSAAPGAEPRPGTLVGTRLAAAAAFAAAVAVLLFAAVPAAAAPAELTVSDLSTSVGQLTFTLTAKNLPGGATLSSAKLSVKADDLELPATVEPIEQPKSQKPTRGVVFVVDTGPGMTPATITAASEAAQAYLSAVPENVAAGLVMIAERPKILLVPTYDRGAFKTALAGLGPHQQSALYDAVSSAAGLFGTEYRERRIVVLSAGAEAGSLATADKVSTVVQADKATLDLVALGPAPAEPTASKLVTGTGGQLARVARADGLSAAFRGLTGPWAPPAKVTATVPNSLSGRDVTITVAVEIDGKRISTSASVAFKTDPKAGPALKEAQVRTLPSGLLLAGIIAFGLALLVAVAVGTHMMLSRSAISQRIRRLTEFSGEKTAVAQEQQEGSVVVRAALAISERAVQRQGQNRIETSLERAGIALRPAEWMLFRGIIALAAGAVFVMLLPWWVGVPVGVLAGWLATGWYRGMRASRRTRKFADLLPEALQLMVGALRSGFSLAQAIDALVREGPEPVAGEFGRAMAEIRLGGDLEDALERTAARNQSRDLAFLVMAIRVQREVGGNLSEVLEIAVETMRERGRLVRHVRALSAEGRLSAYVLTGMPILVSAWLFVSRRDYIKPLYTHPLGLVMLAAAVGLVALGGFWISRLVKVEV